MKAFFLINDYKKSCVDAQPLINCGVGTDSDSLTIAKNLFRVGIISPIKPTYFHNHIQVLQHLREGTKVNPLLKLLNLPV